MIETNKTWIEDKNGNQCSVERWGSEAEARKALDSNKGCFDCSECSGCSRCSRCFDCSGCSRCSECSGCFDCSECFDCSGCSRCSECSGCFDCSECSGCSRCSRCSECSGCSDIKNAKPVAAEAAIALVPIIQNIHQRVYEAASAPDAFSMKNWHSCEKKHCRAGWVVALAGPEGKKLEQFFDTPLAAMKIYDASSTLPKVSPVRFFETDELALADMKRMAELEKAKQIA